MKKNILSIILLVFVLIMSGCSSTKNKLISTANKGGYKVHVNKTKTNYSDEVIIKGRVFDLNTGIPISDAQVTLGCNKIQTSSLGEYSFKTKNSSYSHYFLEVIYFSYKPILTDYLDLTNINEVKIDFYLAKDDRPLIDCPPPGIKIKK
jgi:hypothetical protein